MKSNRTASIIIESNRELGESFQAYSIYIFTISARASSERRVNGRR